MAFWNKSKYTKPRTDYWFDDPNYKAAEAAKGWDDGHSGYGGSTPASSGYTGYGGYTWKPKYDMSASLETRVTGLIKTITGKEVKLAQAQGWGSDEQYFYYNPKDLENATDDEVLGRILQQLSKDLYQDIPALGEAKNKEPQYKELLETLEANRSDRQLGERYYGTRYYASELWEVRKFTDNPVAKYAQGETYNQWVERNKFKEGKKDFAPYESNQDLYLKAYKLGEYMLPGQKPVPDVNPAWEFNFNIHAFQNGEKEFDFSNDKVAEGFSKALPAIDKYLSCPNFDEALASYYPEIKKYYPVPDDQQQKQMQEGMSQTQGLTQQEKKDAAAKASRAKRDGEEGDGDEFYSQFYRDPDGDFKVQNEKRNKATYERYLKEYQGTANVLYALITSILKDNAIKRFARPFKRGKLDAKRMYKYLATDNLRIFKKEREVNKKEYLMAIVVDMSESMLGSNSWFAAKGAIVMANVLERLGFPYEIIAYNDMPYVVKAFNQPLKKEFLPVIEHPDGGTNAEEAVKVLAKRIANYDNTNKYRKSIFWITDGQSMDANFVKKQVTKLEKEHNASVFGIGIGSGISKDLLDASYNTAMKVDNVQQLPKELVNLMKSQFRRG